MKTCSRCKITKSLTEFNKTRTNKDGLSYNCSDCNKEVSRKYRQKNSVKYYQNQKDKRQTEPVFISQLLYSLRTRSSKKGLKVDLTQEDLLTSLRKTNYSCQVTGLKMNLEAHSRKKANPFKCSLDRIDSDKGYTKDNVRWVCWAVNQMKADRTENEFRFWVETLYKAISSQA